MKSFAICLLGLLGLVSVGSAAEPMVLGQVRQSNGLPVVAADVLLFDLADLRRGVVARATTDASGHFALRLASWGGRARPPGFTLGPNYPNPFNPSTVIPYHLPASGFVRLEVFNLLGQRIATLVDGARSAGSHAAVWDATDASGRSVGAGVYIYRLTAGAATATGRMVLVDGQAGVAAVGPSAVELAADSPVYGLAVSGAGLVAYVDADFRVGEDAVDIVLAAPGGLPLMKVSTDGGVLGDVDNNGRVDFFDALLVALYSQNVFLVLPNNGHILLGDVNADGRVDLTDAYVLATYLNNPSDSSLPSGIGQAVRPSGDDHGDTRSDATRLSVGSSVAGQIETGGDVDYFQVQISGSGELVVYTTGSLDTEGRLESSSGSSLATNDNGGRGNNFRIEHSVDSGTYYLQVREHSSSGTGSYTVHASFSGGGGGVAGSSQTFSLPGGSSMDFVWLTPGVFQMGSPDTEEGRDSDEGPVHEVAISRGFYMGMYEVTQGQWESVMGTTPWSGAAYVREDSSHPAVYISWDDVHAFIGRLNDAVGDSLYRLPTEAEWEYACRAGTSTRWSFGDDESHLTHYAWYRANAWSVGEQYGHRVGLKRANPWGLYDMHGNVWEWVQDSYDGDYYNRSPRVDPPGPRGGSLRVVRGGDFHFFARGVRSAFRNSGSPGNRSDVIGVRLLRIR